MSKVPKLFPDEPAMIARGSGCRVWDVDENEYIDFRCALGPITLGYCYPEIDAAIREQLGRGLVFGHPNEWEFRLARELIEVIPCFESVRFLKTGGEAVAAALKLARAFTGHSMVLGCGYHGWLNSVENTDGILQGARDNFRRFSYGSLAEVEALLSEHRGRVAAVLLAPDCTVLEQGDDFPSRLSDLVRASGAVMIVDEIVTGFRLGIGGYHEYYDFQPDLAVYSKGMANGMPLSVVGGRREIMDLSAGRAGISSTFSGEMLSIVAALALLKVYREEDVIAHLWNMGRRMANGMTQIFHNHGLPVEMNGLPPCPGFAFQAGQPKENQRLHRSLFRSFYRHGVSMHILCFVNYSHQADDIDEALERIDGACRDLEMEIGVGGSLPGITSVGVMAHAGL